MRQITENRQELLAEVGSLLKQLSSAERAKVLIVPTFNQVTHYRKELAKQGLSFGVSITTFSAWIEDRWALFGDERNFISSLQREILIYRCLTELKTQGIIEVLAITPGTVSLIGALAKKYLPILENEPFINRKLEILTPAEQEVCRVLQRYSQTLSTEGLCEVSQSLLVLSKDIAGPLPSLVFAGIEEFSVVEESFIEALSSRTEIYIISHEAAAPAQSPDRSHELVELQKHLYNPDPNNPVVPTGAVSFLLPTGKYAASRLLAENIVGYVNKGDSRIALSAKNPATLFSEIAGFLLEKKIEVSVSTQKPFSETAFGKTWMTLIDFMYDSSYSTFQMSDVVLSAFSGLSDSRAYGLDLAWRGDRSCDKERCIDEVRSQNEHLNQILRALEKKEFSAALDSFEKWVNSQFMWDEAYRNEQLSAIMVAREFTTHAQTYGQDVWALRDLLAHQSVSYHACVRPSEKLEKSDRQGKPGKPGQSEGSDRSDKAGKPSAAVTILTLEALSDEEPISYDTVIVTDLDAASYPIKARDDAEVRLLSKLDITEDNDSLARARRVFYEVTSVPIRQLVCMRALNSVDANPNYPSVMLEELVDCYREDLLSLDEMDELSGVPKKLIPYTQIVGEGALYSNLAISESPQEIGTQEVLVPSVFISESNRSKIALPHQKGTGTSEELCLSPSAVETYLECPYKWFSLRRLRLEGIDAGFGALEMGSFVHRLLKGFYRHFQNTVAPKVTLANLDQAKVMLGLFFDQHIGMQAELKKNENPLIAHDQLEREELASLKKKLMSYLEREALFLTDFTPRYFEYSFGDDVLFEYAGCTLHGSIDRIDMNDRGQAVVVDYKGSVTSEYSYNNGSEVPWIQKSTEDDPVILPYKVQTMLYAQAVRKTFDCEVVGAVYLSYGRDAKIAGAYDRCVLGPAELLGIDSEACGVGGGAETFGEELDKVEQAISLVAQSMASGHIAPYPRGKDPCGFCPVTACEKRKRS